MPHLPQNLLNIVQQLVLILLLNLCSSAAFAQRDQAIASTTPTWEELLQRSPWVFLGDSNTYAGDYIAMLDTWLQAAHALDSSSPRPQLLNLGVPSETASGLSEVDHPFKRPCVHERIDKVLAMTKPGVVFICYGMNDGIYQPPSDENLAAYVDGMRRLVDKVRTVNKNVYIVCLTPPIFEPEPVAKRKGLGPSPAGRYAYFAPALNYNDAIRQQADWCLKNEMGADLVLDTHRLLSDAKIERKKVKADFSFSNDGIHYGSEAHYLVAEQIARALGAPNALLEMELAPDDLQKGRRRMQVLRDAYLSATGKNRPGLPAGYPIWYAEKLTR